MLFLESLQYHIALTINPDLAGAHYNLGLAYTKERSTDRAIEHFEAAARLAPTNAVFLDTLARAYEMRTIAGKVEHKADSLKKR